MDQDAWYGGSPRPRPHCVRWGPSSPAPNGAQQPQFSTHVCCGQSAGWIKMPHGTEVCLSSGHIVLDGDPAPPKGAQLASPIFSPFLLWPNGSPSQPISARLLLITFSTLRRYSLHTMVFSKLCVVFFSSSSQQTEMICDKVYER